MSAAENFVGASVTYLDGTVTNTGDKTVSHAVVHVVFKDAMGQTAQLEDLPIRVVQTVGPYADAVDLAMHHWRPARVNLSASLSSTSARSGTTSTPQCR